MRHNIEIEGWGVRMRPVEFVDAEFIVQMRRAPFAKRWLNDTDPDVTKQIAWIERYYERPDDYYFCVEAPSGVRVGMIGLYNIEGQSAEIGRLFITPGVPAAAATTLLTNTLAFDTFNMKILHWEVMADNTKVLSFHKRYGARETGILHSAHIIGGSPVDMIKFELTRDDWPKAAELLTKYALLAERWFNAIAE